MSGIDVERVRADFPVLRRAAGSRPPAYLDSACTTLRPEPVIQAVADCQREVGGCPGRSGHAFGRAASERLRSAREAVRAFLGAGKVEEVVFVRSATEGINLVAQGLDLPPGATVLTTGIEHNSNFLPWQRLQERGAARHRILRVDVECGLDFDAFETALDGAALVAVCHVSNLCGIELPVARMCEAAHRRGALVLVDGAQAPATTRIDVRALGADFYVLSFHKMFGPAGVGALYGRAPALERLDPPAVGGGAVDDADYEGFRLADLPERLEPGVPDVEGAAGAAAAIAYLQGLGVDACRRHAVELNRRATDALVAGGRVRLIGPADPELRGSILNFHVPGVPSAELASLLDRREGVMARHGKQCVHGWYHAEGVPDSVRVSFAAYNTVEEVDRLVAAVRSVVALAGRPTL